MERTRNSKESHNWWTQVIILVMFGGAGLLLAIIAAYLLLTLANPGTATAGTSSQTPTFSGWLQTSYPTSLPEITVEPTETNTPTLTSTSTPTSTKTYTVTQTATASPSITLTRTRTRTRTPTRTQTRTSTRTPTISLTRTATRTITNTLSQTPTLTATATSTSTATETATPTPTSTCTSTRTAYTSQPTTTVIPSVAVFTGHSNAVNAVAYNPATATPSEADVVTGDETGELKFWLIPSLTPTQSYTPAATAGVNDLAFSPSGAQVASAGSTGWIEFWHPAGTTPPTFYTHTSEVTALAYLSTGEEIIFGSSDSSTQLLEIATCSLENFIYGGRTEAVTDVAVSPGDQWVASSGLDGRVLIWDKANPAGVPRVLPSPISPYSSGAISVDFSKYGGLLATGWADGHVYVYKTTDWGIEKDIDLSGVVIQKVLFSPNAERLAVAGSDGTIHIFDTNGWYKLFELDGTSYGAALSIDFSPDGVYLISGHQNNSAVLWQLL